MQKFRYILLAFIGVILGSLLRISVPAIHTVAAGVTSVIPTAAVSAPAYPRAGFPTRLEIPSLAVDVAVEPVGKDEEKRMDVPRDIFNAAWYAYGVRPGETGNAVLAGHYDTPTGEPNIFYRLTSLQAGDAIRVSDDRGQVWEFRVTDVLRLPNEGFPIRDVFGETDKSRLNLITCGGAFIRETGTYADRIVVYSEFFAITSS